MTHPRVQMFLRDRDRAKARGDWGIFRAITADLRRLGVSDEATLADPSGRGGAAKEPTETKRAKAPRARCEHGALADRCEACRMAEIEDARASAPS